LYWNPPFPFPLENNLAMVDFVELQKATAEYLDEHSPGAKVASAWPYTGALRMPDLGFTNVGYRVVETSDFHTRNVTRGLSQRSPDVLIVYSRTWEPPHGAFWAAAVFDFLRRYYDYEPQITTWEVQEHLKMSPSCAGNSGDSGSRSTSGDRTPRVTKSFSGKRSVTALHNVSLSIAKGDMVSIVGPSGSGKSTLLNLIGGLDRATAGEIRLTVKCSAASMTINSRACAATRSASSFSSSTCCPRFRALENVSIPLHLRGWPRKKIEDRARELLGLVGLGDRLEHLPEEMSGGERQRVAIARALSVYPPILLADEPTGNLDTHTGADILKLIHDLHDRLGATVLIVTHDRNVAESCPRTYYAARRPHRGRRTPVILLRLISWQYVRKHVLRTLLTLAGIVLGVAVFVGMHTANQSVLFAFQRTIDRIAGATQLQVSAGETGFEEAVLQRVQDTPGVRVAVPVIEAVVNTGVSKDKAICSSSAWTCSATAVFAITIWRARKKARSMIRSSFSQADSLILTKAFAQQNNWAPTARSR
jgi:putative ABC transport system ATP-binding protein